MLRAMPRIDRARRNVILLAACQALAMSGATLIGTTSALVGHSLAIDKSLATVPLALQFLITMAATIPASLLMRRIGRRGGFMLGAGCGAIGALLMTYAVLAASFALFAVGSAVTGIFYGFVIFYRFAATDTADEAFQSKAISAVLAGGVVAAVAGPNLARWTKDMIEPVVFAGPYAALAVLCLVSMAVLALIDIPAPTAAERRERGRPLRTILRQPVCAVAILCGPVSYGVMSLVMTATPLAMLACDLDFDDTAQVIQWHVLGMYAPSFITGHLIARYGVLNVMTAGAVLLVASLSVNLSGITLAHFWVGLVLLGMGWNFLFVGSTALLTRAYQPAEKAKVQGLNDFLVYGSVTLAALFSGALQHGYGWDVVNYGVGPLIVSVLIAVQWLRLRRLPAAA